MEADMLLVVRHNIPYANKVFDVNVELMGIASSVEEAKSHVDSEVADYLKYNEGFDDPEHKEWTVNADGTYSLLYDIQELAYDIIPVAAGFPDKYVKLAGPTFRDQELYRRINDNLRKVFVDLIKDVS